MKLIIHDSELKESRDLNELYNQLIAELCTGNATGKYTDVSGTRIELDELDAEDAMVRQCRRAGCTHHQRVD